MFDAPVDAWYVWLGVALASTTAFGLAASLPDEPPPDAAGVAATVDAVAASQHATTATHPLGADAVKLAPNRVALRADGTVAHATFAYGPVVPVVPGSGLWEVLRGTPPDHAFSSSAEFRHSVESARERPASWRACEELTVRTVSWEGVDVTLVG
ncbi:DUF7283 family protein [Halorussus halophilus]|uniref:DUF7283 family protein n=1 Tax=Halorussus halophilus TaxID=2650975 RepID=UPI001300DB52|nr:hypothetical protein [Halorussus halophilus]